jgi:hypothetical protein
MHLYSSGVCSGDLRFFHNLCLHLIVHFRRVLKKAFYIPTIAPTGPTACQQIKERADRDFSSASPLLAYTMAWKQEPVRL